jgi:hypothetical protein
MSPIPQPDERTLDEEARLEAATDQAIEVCGGDIRAAVKALIIANEFLERRVSHGYMRGAVQGRINCYSG